MPNATFAVLAESSRTPVLTVASARHSLARKFRAAGIESASLDACVLVGYALSLPHAALAAAGPRLLRAEETATIAVLARRRLAREPVARIIGSKEFWSLKLGVDSSTLVPRPETETVVEVALAAIGNKMAGSRPLQIADLGTGSGALLLALLSELPNASGIGTDTSVGALQMAQHNSHRLGLVRAMFVACDMAAALAGPFDLIVSNPPYIASGEISALAPEVREFDPRAALDGGQDGLSYYRSIAASVPTLLKPNGVLAVELGVGQARAVAELFSTAGLAPSPPHADLRGMPRVLVASKAAGRA
jgi:release factor glutamine methyltransferase